MAKGRETTDSDEEEGGGRTVQYIMRLPETMRAALKEAAARNHRSLNGEILARLSTTMRDEVQAKEREMGIEFLPDGRERHTAQSIARFLSDPAAVREREILNEILRVVRALSDADPETIEAPAETEREKG